MVVGGSRTVEHCLVALVFFSALESEGEVFTVTKLLLSVHKICNEFQVIESLTYRRKVEEKLLILRRAKKTRLDAKRDESAPMTQLLVTELTGNRQWSLYTYMGGIRLIHRTFSSACF